MRGKRSNIVYIQHMQDALQKIIGYSSSHSYNDLLREEWDQDAVMRNLEIIGEAANNLDESFRGKYSEIPWRKIIDFRNVVVHHYADLDLEVVWQIITTDIPPLKKKIESILSEEKDNTTS